MIHSTQSRGHARWVLVAVLGLCALAGCNGENRLPTHPVSGKVMFDGKPLSGAEIWLVPTDANAEVKNAKMTIRPYAKSNADGMFTMTSYVKDDGAPPGEYVVIVQKAAGGANENDPEADPETPRPTKGNPKTGAAQQTPRFPGKFGSPATSGLSFTVKEGQNNQLNLDLKSK